MKVSILIPVYNEARTLQELLRRVQNAALARGCTREIIVIDDGSDDGTNALLRQRPSEIVFIRNDRNRGKGAAIRTGVEAASGDVILIQDGDLEYDPDYYEALLEPIVHGQAVVVYGSRFLGSAKEMKWQNRIANAVLTFATNLLFRTTLTDQATAYKAFRTEVFRRLNLQSNGFDFCAEVTAKLLRLGYEIYEVPISYQARSRSEGKKIRCWHGIEALWTLMKYRFGRIGIAKPLANGAEMIRLG